MCKNKIQCTFTKCKNSSVQLMRRSKHEAQFAKTIESIESLASLAMAAATFSHACNLELPPVLHGSIRVTV